MYLNSTDRDVITLNSVQDCIEHGMMDTLARREMWMNESDVFETLKVHWSSGVRYDVSLALHTRLNCCIPSYRAGTLT